MITNTNTNTNTNSNENEKFFNNTYNKYYNKLLSLNTFLSKGNTFVASEVTTLTFLKLYKYIDLFESNKSDIYTYICNINKSVIIDYYRKEKKSELNISIDNTEVSIQIESNLNSDSNLLAKEKNRSINKIIDTVLKENEKTVIKLFFFNELTLKEIVEITNFSISNVKILLLRGKEKLKPYLSELR